MSRENVVASSQVGWPMRLFRVTVEEEEEAEKEVCV